MRFAQTIVDEPKYGASSRDAVISVASAPMPAPKTSAPSARLPGRSPATADLQAEDALDLAEGSRCEDDRDGDDDREHEPEANAGPALLAMPASLRGTPGAVVAVRARDRVGIERGSSSRCGCSGVEGAGWATGEF